MKYYIFGTILSAFSFITLADTYVPGTRTTITSVTTYQYGVAAGDVSIKVAKTVAGCESGYFMIAGTEGLKNNLSSALSAFHSNSNIIIGGRSGVSWDATGRTDYCKVHSITLEK